MATNRDFEDWVESYSDELYRWARHKTGDGGVAEDLVQDTFLSAYESKERFKGNSSPKTWLMSILRNKITDYFRKKVRESTRNQTDLKNLDNGRDVIDDFFREDGSWKEDKDPRTWSEGESEDGERKLKICLGLLPEVWATIVRLKYLNEESGENICQELEITPSNYWQILHRAKLKLRGCLNKKSL